MLVSMQSAIIRLEKTFGGSYSFYFIYLSISFFLFFFFGVGVCGWVGVGVGGLLMSDSSCMLICIFSSIISLSARTR